jgi:hypothetical protein
MMTCRQNERVTEWKTGFANPLILLVGAAGFEPAAPCSQSRCSTRLSYAPSRNFRGLLAPFRHPENGQEGNNRTTGGWTAKPYGSSHGHCDTERCCLA